MQIPFLRTDASGVSHFEDRTVNMEMHDFAPPAPPMFMSSPDPAAKILFLELPVGWRDDAHCSPKRQIAFCLSGRMKVTAGSGETRIIEPGGLFWAEDVTGGGHASAVVGETPLRLAIVQLD